MTLEDLKTKTRFELLMMHFNHHDPGDLLPPLDGVRVILWDPVEKDYFLGSLDQAQIVTDEGETYCISDEFYFRDLPEPEV